MLTPTPVNPGLIERFPLTLSILARFVRRILICFKIKLAKFQLSIESFFYC